MFGKFLSKTIKVVTLPVDAVNAAQDIVFGGDGSKRSRNKDDFNPFSDVEKIRDRITETVEEIDD